MWFLSNFQGNFSRDAAVHGIQNVLVLRLCKCAHHTKNACCRTTADGKLRLLAKI
jgi:hypothetical protein